MPTSILPHLSNAAAAAVLAGTRDERVALARHAVDLDAAEVARLERLTRLTPEPDDLLDLQLEGARDALHYSREALDELLGGTDA